MTNDWVLKLKRSIKMVYSSSHTCDHRYCYTHPLPHNLIFTTFYHMHHTHTHHKGGKFLISTKKKTAKTLLVHGKQHFNSWILPWWGSRSPRSLEFYCHKFSSTFIHSDHMYRWPKWYTLQPVSCMPSILDGIKLL
jgi:hypothetical protein